jgi:membrane-associated phospholipid phosphatase
MRRVLRAALLVSLAGSPARGQAPTSFAYHASAWDIASVLGAGALYLAPAALNVLDTTGSCAPCDPATLPGIDRWAVDNSSSNAALASGVALAVVAAGAGYASMAGVPAPQARGNLAVLANSAAWSATFTEWLKNLFHRERPVLYTADAPAVVTDLDNHKSFPSGHTAVAVAVATTYLILAEREQLPHRDRNAWLLFGGAALVGTLRIVAGKHFPTDVLGAAAVGAGVGWLVPTVHR